MNGVFACTLLNCDLSGSLLSMPHRLATVYTTRAKITSIINKTQSTISLFQSSLIPHLCVNELRFRHRYQRHSMFNYSYRACSFCHCCLASLFLLFFFFLAFKKSCLHAARRCGEWQLSWTWSYVCPCCTEAPWSRAATQEEFQAMYYNTVRALCFYFSAEHTWEQVRSISALQILLHIAQI